MSTPSGIPSLGDLPDCAHVGQLYRDRTDLLETLVPFFASGLRQRERCIWVCAEPLSAATGRSALAQVVPDLADLEHRGQIQIVDHADWYREPGELGADETIAAWLAAEHDALAAGYRGLRINGNTHWLEPEHWQAFADYEAKAHAAFREHKIVALCSYPLSRCDPHQVVDVLHTHSTSLVRSGSRWDVVHGATAALASLEIAGEPTGEARGHSVEFYRDDLPMRRVAAPLVSALSRGRAAGALATRAHLSALRAELGGAGIDVDGALARGQLVLFDADALFVEAWTDPGVRTEVIERRLAGPLRRATQRHGSCTLFGELVDLLARAGDRAAALELERWWNLQVGAMPLTVACAYSLESFHDVAAAVSLERVCGAHQEAGIAAAAATATASEVDRLRVEIAQVTHALAKEMTKRQLVEAAYTSARDARDHLVLLNRLTASLGEVTTRAQFAALVRDPVSRALEAAGLALVEADADDDDALVAAGAAVTALCLAARRPTLRATWSHDVTQLPGAPAELRGYAILPVAIGPRRLATLALGFAGDRAFTAPYRALVEDIARQLALALDRASSYERLEQERERAESASRAKDEFLAMLGHELRNPLSPILTATQLMRLRGEELFERERTVIERQCQHMVRLVDDLLDVSRITRGKVELRRRPVEVSEAVAQAVELASPALEERAHRLALDVPSSGVVVHADPQRLAQVLANLLTNAAKYTPHGGSIRVKVRAADSAVWISVRDSGIGIDPKLLPQVFDRFVQGRQGIDRAAGGLGLGLTIARTLVELHGGTIAVDSAGQGQGSEFTIELPRYANTRPSARHVKSGGFALAAPTHGFHVLVVDDNEDAAFLLAEALTGLGHHVDIAHDGPSALAVARSRPPEICFLDIGLPVMDGYELGRRLREVVGPPAPKLVAITGYGNSSDRERSRDAGFALHLVKPVDLTAIQDALAQCVQPAELMTTKPRAPEKQQKQEPDVSQRERASEKASEKGTIGPDRHGNTGERSSIIEDESEVE